MNFERIPQNKNPEDRERETEQATEGIVAKIRTVLTWNDLSRRDREAILGILERRKEEIEKAPENQNAFNRLKVLPSLIVKRSSGEMDDGWKVIDIDGDLVRVSNKKGTLKTVRVADLERWNKDRLVA